MITYVSTRGGSEPVSAAQAIIRGLAPDGGLYVPSLIPAFSQEEKASLASLSYQETAVLILEKYLDFDREAIREMVRKAYASFDTPEPAPLVCVSDSMTSGQKREAPLSDLWSMELWHGPSCAFKDIALQLLPLLLRASLDAEGVTDTIHILTATSGDTGKAALDGFHDVPGTAITVFYPHGGVSMIQKAQMTRQVGDNVSVVAVEGNFDTAQTGVKQIFADRALSEKLASKGVRLSSANSINWGRLLPQIVYYAYAASHILAERPTSSLVNFAVPTGNFGDILAGYLAKKMGAPVGRLLCISNENNVLTDFLETGCYNRLRPFYKTTSPSMDILVSSNLERLLYWSSREDTASVRQCMSDLQDKGTYSIPLSQLAEIREDFSAVFCNRTETADGLRSLFASSGYLMDPHTAVAYQGLVKMADPGGEPEPWVMVSTASPFKFSETVLDAILPVSADPEATIPSEDGFEAMRLLSRLSGVPIPASLSSLETLPVRFSTVVSPEAMADILL